MEKEEIIKIAKKYYSRNDIAKAISSYAKNREIVIKYYDKFGKRPDIIEYANDVKVIAEKNGTSFHCSVELWKEPLALAKELNEKEINENRIGWDLLIDIDCPFLDYSKEAAKLIIEALELHGIKNYGIKFSGNKGFHIVISHKAFPEKIKFRNEEILIKDFFPQGTRIIANFIADFIEKDLRNAILSLNTLDEIAKATNKEKKSLLINNKFNPYSIITLDSMIMSSRHLYRMPYSLHEKTGLVSIVINKAQLNSLNLSMAKPSSVIIKPFIKNPNPDEAKELLINALDWQDNNKIFIAEFGEGKIEYKKEYEKIKKIKITNLEEVYCGCIKKILEGIKQDGRKRALFVLITYLRSIGVDLDKIEKIIYDWNKKNYKELKEGYIKSQLNWFKKQTKIILPPNHDSNIYYADIGILTEECKKFKNPLSYTAEILKKKRKSK
ncbi:MAG: DNA primase small subunit domain-containing protein [Candidatus Pacearchaeota archaeon]